jgi:hypothetical protein
MFKDEVEERLARLKGHKYETGDHVTIYRLFKRWSELDTGYMIDAGNYGADGGFNGFISHYEMGVLWEHYHEIIANFINERTLEVFGENWLIYIGENIQKQHKNSVEYYHEYIIWAALELIGQWLQSLIEQKGEK